LCCPPSLGVHLTNMLPTQPNPDRRPQRHACAQARRPLIQYHARLQAISNSTAKLAHQSLYMAAHYALGPVHMPVPSTPCRSAHNIQRLHGQRKWVARNRPWLFIGVARYLIERCRTVSHRLVLQRPSTSSDAPPRALYMSSWTKVPQVTGLLPGPGTRPRSGAGPGSARRSHRRPAAGWRARAGC